MEALQKSKHNQNIEENVKTLKSYLEENILAKENLPEIPETGMAVLRQQLILVQAIEWKPKKAATPVYQQIAPLFRKI